MASPPCQSGIEAYKFIYCVLSLTFTLGLQKPLTSNFFMYSKLQCYYRSSAPNWLWLWSIATPRNWGACFPIKPKSAANQLLGGWGLCLLWIKFWLVCSHKWEFSYILLVDPALSKQRCEVFASHSAQFLPYLPAMEERVFRSLAGGLKTVGISCIILWWESLTPYTDPTQCLVHEVKLTYCSNLSVSISIFCIS